MSFLLSPTRLAEFLDRHPRLRRSAPIAAGVICLVCASVCVLALMLGSLERSFARGYIVAFEAHLSRGDAHSLDAHLLLATQAEKDVRERVLVGLGESAIVFLRVDGNSEEARATGRRIVTLLPADTRVFEPTLWPLLPENPSLFARFAGSEVRAAFEREATRVAGHWKSAGGNDLPQERKVVVTVDPTRIARYGLQRSDVEAAIKRGFDARPPLPDVNARRIVPSAWEPIASTPSDALQRALNLTVESSKGREIPLSEVASVRWSLEAAPETAPERIRADNAPFFPTRSWLRDLSSQRNTEAARPWRSAWTREDALVLAGLILASVCAAIAMMGTIGAPVDVGFALIFALAFSALSGVSPGADDAPLPQARLLMAAAFLWGAFRLLPWRLTVRARAAWNILQGGVFVAIVGVLSLGFFDGSEANHAPREAAAHASTLRAFKLSDGDTLPLSFDETRTPSGHVHDAFRTEITTQAGPIAVVLREPKVLAAPARTLTVTRNGAPAQLPDGSGDLGSSPAWERYALWVTVSLGAGALAAALMGLRTNAWTASIALQLVAGIASVGLAALLTQLTRLTQHTQLHGLADIAGTAAGGDPTLQFEVLIPWTMGLVSLLAIWLTARAQRLQARQTDSVHALRVARRHVQRTAFTFLACAGVIWPTVLLVDRFVSLAVVVTLWISGVFLIPCLAVTMGQKIQDALAYWRLVGRVKSLARRRSSLDGAMSPR
jgi:hypothetical protein